LCFNLLSEQENTGSAKGKFLTMIEKIFKSLEKKSNRTRAEAMGRAAESLAAVWYESKGYVTLANRLRTACGEIDLIVANPAIVIFVEVKARRTAQAAAEAVTMRQQTRLIHAAEIILAEHPRWGRELTRFDVILVVAGEIIPIHDAFQAN
jgi:putative endonuclease